MKHTVVNLSTVASHPFQSLLPADYLGDPDYVKEMVFNPTPSNQKRVHWMLEQGIVTEEQLSAYVQEMVDAVMKRPVEQAERFKRTLADLLGSTTTGEPNL
jgi:hypothetical protein